MARKAYNVRNVTMIITYKGQKHYVNGFSKGSEIKCSKNSERYKGHTGMKGDTTFAATNDDSGKIEFSLKTDSPSNALFDEICEEDECFDVEVVDGNDMTRGEAKGTDCVINKQSDWSRGNEIKDRKWVIAVPNLSMGDKRN